MGPEEREAAVAAVLSDADALWRVLTAEVVVLDRWEVAQHGGISYGPESRWRLDPCGEHGALVTPSARLEQPKLYQYMTGSEGEDADGEPLRTYYDDERFERDVASYERLKTQWKPWTVWLRSDDDLVPRFADTREEGMALADATLRERGVLLRTGGP